jgi:phage protein U
MIGVMMQLGAFKFSLSTAAYQAFSHSTSFRWQGIERYGQIPAQQYTGPGEESITISGDIYPSFAGGTGQLNSMRAEAYKGTALTLVDGNGFAWGKWVILSIEEAQEVFFSDGTPRKMSFNLKLTRYNEDVALSKGGSSGSGINASDIRTVTINDDAAWLKKMKNEPPVTPDNNKWADKADFKVTRVK